MKYLFLFVLVLFSVVSFAQKGSSIFYATDDSTRPSPYDIVRYDTLKVRVLIDYTLFDKDDSSARAGWYVAPIALFKWVWKIQPVTKGHIWMQPWYLDLDKKKPIPDSEVWEKNTNY